MLFRSIQSAFESVSTGVWEVPGALYTDDTRAYVAGNAPGAKPANEAAETETQLRLFMFARVSSTNFATAGNVFVEQNGNVERDRENFALAGSDADRDYWYGEDEIDEAFGESTDFNTADSKQWVQIGAKEGYDISKKENLTITRKEIVGDDDSVQVRQIRWVIKAVPAGSTVEDDSLAHEVPVPHGFRLDVDAVPDKATGLKELNGHIYEDDDPADRKSVV